MSENTQSIVYPIHFDVLLRKCFDGLIGVSPQLLIHRTVLVLSLTTGLEMKDIMALKWNDVLALGSENDAEVKDELKVRKYVIPIHPKVKTLLSQIYGKLGFPKLDSILYNYEMLPEYTKEDKYNAVEMIIKSGSLKSLGFLPLFDDYFKEWGSDDYTQKIFGRKVFEVNGYTNEVSKKLKQHFNFKLNKELFDFLGYSSIKEIKYDLSGINLTNGEGIKFDSNSDTLILTKGLVKLEDKNFNNGYPFQSFSAFSKFLISGNTFYRKPVTNSIRILLLMSLYNGIRTSTLIKLKWKDIVKIDENEKTVEILTLGTLDEYTIRIGKEIIDKLTYHLKLSIERATDIELRMVNDYQIRYVKKPNLNTPVFVTNTDNALTQPSLSREIKKALNHWKFPHAEKLTSKSTVIMYGRKIIEIKGDHKPTIKKLKEHFNFKSQKDLFDFLHIDYNKEKAFKGKPRPNIFEEILYDL